MNIVPSLLNYPQPQPPNSISLVLEPFEKIHPQEYECMLISYIRSGLDCQGKILLTNFRCIFMTTKETLYDQNRLVFDMPIGYISKCESSSEMINKTMVFYIEILTKFGYSIKLKSLKHELAKLSEDINNNLATKFHTFVNNEDQIQKNSQSKQGKHFNSNSVLNELTYSDSCAAINECWETNEKYQQTFGLENDPLAELYENSQWKLMPLYPLKFKVPRPFIGKRLTTSRIVILSHTYEYQKGKSAALWRTGPGRVDPSEQQWVPKAAKSNDHIIIDIRNKTIGSNKVIATRAIQLDSAYHLRQSFNKMIFATLGNQGDQQYKWIVHVNSCRWFEQLEILLSEAYLIYDKLSSGVHVTIISQWDVRGAQIVALVELITKPQSRTVKGFGLLIEKQFLSFGHYLPGDSKKQKSEDKGIALIQFLDCVHQLMLVYPLSFEFNNDFLTYIALHVYSRKYGNFLYFTRNHMHFSATSNSVVPTTTFIEEKQRKSKLYEIQIKCKNIWAYFHPDNTVYKYYLNPFYVGHKQCDLYELKDKISMKNFKLWGHLFLRDTMIYGQRVQQNQVLRQYRQIFVKYLNTKKQTEILRSKISKQHKQITEKKGVLKQLKKAKLD